MLVDAAYGQETSTITTKHGDMCPWPHPIWSAGGCIGPRQPGLLGLGGAWSR